MLPLILTILFALVYLDCTITLVVSLFLQKYFPRKAIRTYQVLLSAGMLLSSVVLLYGVPESFMFTLMSAGVYDILFPAALAVASAALGATFVRLYPSAVPDRRIILAIGVMPPRRALEHENDSSEEDPEDTPDESPAPDENADGPADEAEQAE